MCLQSAGAEQTAAGRGGAALTMRVSGGLTKRVRLDVFSRCAGVEFMTAYASLTSDPHDQLWNISHDTAAAQSTTHVRRSPLIAFCGP